jgi:hypothetical protein
MYSRKSSFHCSASCSGTTPLTTATPRFLNSLLKVSGALSMSWKSITGMTLEPSSTMSGISSRSPRSKRSQDSRTSFSRPLIRRPLRSAYSGVNGLNSCPERDANASEMSPARFCACVAAVRSCVANRLVGVRTVRSVESMANANRWSYSIWSVWFRMAFSLPKARPLYSLCCVASSSRKVVVPTLNRKSQGVGKS